MLQVTSESQYFILEIQISIGLPLTIIYLIKLKMPALASTAVRLNAERPGIWGHKDQEKPQVLSLRLETKSSYVNMVVISVYLRTSVCCDLKLIEVSNTYRHSESVMT